MSWHVIDTISFIVIPSAFLIAFGVLHWHRMQKHFMAHWTRDKELFHWRQARQNPWHEDCLSYLYLRYSQLIPVVFLLPPILFLFDRSENVSSLWLFIAIVQPAFHLGIAFADILFFWRFSKSVTIVDTGVIVPGMFLPWKGIAAFEYDPQEWAIRLYPRSSPRALLGVLQPPDAVLGEQVLSVLRQYVAERPARAPGAWYRHKTGWEGRLTALFLGGVTWSAFLYLFPNRQLSCCLLAIGFWALIKLSVRLAEQVLGIRFADSVHGLTRADLSPPAAVPDRILPGSTRLRPLSLGELLDTTFRLYRQHFGVFVGVAALLYVPMTILLTLLGRSLASTAIYLVVQSLIVSALVNVAAHSYMGRPISILGAYRLGRVAVSLIVAALVPLFLDYYRAIYIFAEGVGSSLTSPLGRSGVLPAALSALLGLLLPFLSVWFLSAYLLVACQVVMIEGRGPLTGWIRSCRLIHGSFWRAVGVMACTAVFTYLLTTLPTEIPLALNANGVGLTIVARLTAQIGRILALPIQVCACTLLYYDLRIRKEGYDLEANSRAEDRRESPDQLVGV